MTKKEQIDKYGWMVIKNVFSNEEIETFREYAEKDKDHKGDLLSAKFLSKIITDKRIIDIYKESTGHNSLIYFGDSTLSYNTSLSGFHKDSRDRDNKESLEFKDKDYSLLRLGIYLQDHSKHSKGLCLRTESHLQQSIEKGKIINVKSEVGDVIIWKLTTTHSPNADIISLFPNHSFHPGITKRLPNFLKKKSISPRLALFMGFGVEDKYTKDYIEYLKTRAYAISRWENSNYNPEDIETLKRMNVKVLTDFNLSEVNQAELNTNFKQV
ncbi:hypothetical protein [Winogradskyella forsetii]|uniref:hypothetical protein n=1 Tax=Winogradskyella forsetii TaxID=2686077 RepID=UPI0015C0FD83|nr:hypothetical protein [Winogradskyella forsetii]